LSSQVSSEPLFNSVIGHLNRYPDVSASDDAFTSNLIELCAGSISKTGACARLIDGNTAEMMRQSVGSRILLSVSLLVITSSPVANEPNQVKADVAVFKLPRFACRLPGLRQFLARRIAVENLDQSLVQLIKSLATFLIEIDLCVRCPDEFVALPVDDLEG
jgi:hypothetical protein